MPEINEDTKMFAIIGDPVGHSLSPFIQNRLIEMAGFNGLYLPIHLRRGDIKRLPFLQSSVGLAGWNLTMPHKEDIIPLLTAIDPAADQTSSVNIVLVKEKGWHGFSSDGPGFLRSLIDASFDPTGKRVVILGAGGAGRAVAHALEGAAEITVVNRNLDRAQELVNQLGTTAQARAWGDWTALKECDLMVNTTSLGMHGVENEFADASFLSLLPKDALVTDLIYNPSKTRFLIAAEESGHRCVNGLGMLVHQAILTFSYFWGSMPGEKEVAEIFDALGREKGFVRL